LHLFEKEYAESTTPTAATASQHSSSTEGSAVSELDGHRSKTPGSSGVDKNNKGKTRGKETAAEQEELKKDERKEDKEREKKDKDKEEAADVSVPVYEFFPGSGESDDTVSVAH
jgi:hypothetical protein